MATWRLIITDSETLSGVAPVCPRAVNHEGGHDHPLDASVNDCCPGPHLEAWTPSAARELVHLLNRLEVGVCD